MKEIINNSRIGDILVEREDKNNKFNSYEEASTIGKKIYKSFLGLWKKNKGVSLTGKEEGKYGTISNIMALSSMLEFASMGVDITKEIDKFHFLIESVFSAVYKGSYTCFDASPYFNNSDEDRIETYVETASKICITMIDLRKYAITRSIAGDEWIGTLTIDRREVNSFDELADHAERLLTAAMRSLADSCLPTREHERQDYNIGGHKIVRDGLDSMISHRGWAFQKPDRDADQYGVSIYYTYHATNAYVSLYNAFPHILTSDFFATGRIDERVVSEYSDDQLKRFDRDLKFIVRCKPDIARFRELCSSCGRYFDTMLRNKDIDLSFDYVKTGFGKINAATILDSQKNNYVMETLFVISILMNAGVDEDYEFVGQDDYIYNQILYSLTNIKKIYNVLRRNNREDLIDSYMLSSAMFSEKVPSKYNDLIRKFRTSCENISPMGLVPLLCNTYSIVFSFLVKYPTKDMVDNLELIMENRAYGDDWYWDKDGFNINNNLYYIVAIENFYDYFNEYELPYMEHGKEYNKKAEEAYAELREKSADFESAKKKIKELEELYDSKKSTLDAEVIKIAEKIFNDNFEKRLNQYFESMIEDCIKLSIHHVNGDDELSNLLVSYPRAEMLLKMANAENFVDIVSKYNGSMALNDDEEVEEISEEISGKIKDQLESKKK